MLTNNTIHMYLPQTYMFMCVYVCSSLWRRLWGLCNGSFAGATMPTCDQGSCFRRQRQNDLPKKIIGNLES